jgi:hypothetical protein
LSASLGSTLALALVMGIVVEDAIFPTPLADVRLPPLFHRLATQPRTSLLEVPIPDDPAVFPQRMLWQTVHGHPVFGGYLSRSLPSIPFDAVPGFAQFKSLASSIDDVVTYDPEQLPSLSRAILNAYGAGHVVIERQLMSPQDGERARAMADGLLGENALRFVDDLTLDYAIPTSREVVTPAVWLDTGWSYLERRPEDAGSGRTLRWRWLGNRARLGVLSTDSARVRLQLILEAFGRPRRVRVEVNAVEITTLSVAQARGLYQVSSFQIPGGTTFIDLKSVDGADSPGADPRRLSVALFKAELVTAP